MFLAQGVLNNQITISVTVEQIIAWLIVGLIAGLLASIFVRGRMSLAGAVLLGLVGAVVGGFLIFQLLNVEIKPDSDLAGGILIRWIDIVVAFIGAIIVLFLSSLFFWRRL